MTSYLLRTTPFLFVANDYKLLHLLHGFASCCFCYVINFLTILLLLCLFYFNGSPLCHVKTYGICAPGALRRFSRRIPYLSPCSVFFTASHKKTCTARERWGVRRGMWRGVLGVHTPLRYVQVFDNTILSLYFSFYLD